MKQIVLEEPGRLIGRDVPPPADPTGQTALVRVRRIGVCGTDLHAFAGRQPFFSYPRVLGHELGVEVLHAPANDRGIGPGDRCAVEPYVKCGECHACRIGKDNCCEHIQTLGVQTDGAMQEVFALPVGMLYKSDKLSTDQLALVETLGVGAHAVQRGRVEPGTDVLIVGAGPIGLAAAQFALALGADVRVLERIERRRRFVGQLGAETLSEPDDRTAEVVIDATGNKTSMEGAFQFVAHGGKLVFVGVVQDDITFPDTLFHRREMDLLGSRNSTGVFPTLIEMIENGRIDTAPWITHRMSLADVPDEFPRLARQPDLVKAIIQVEDSA